MSELLIRPLTPADAPALSRLLTADPPEYGRYFLALDTAAESLARALGTADRDRYFAITIDQALAALFMLRGFDAGYDVPAFSVYVSQQWSRQGLSRMALAYAEAWCRVTGCRAMMLSVDDDNVHARRQYERAGFRPSGERSPRGHPILRKDLTA